MIEIAYSDATGFTVYDKCRLTPFEDGLACLHVDTAAEALNGYTTYISFVMRDSLTKGEAPIYFPSATDAINELHSYRMK